jgi:hypothetical protein
MVYTNVRKSSIVDPDIANEVYRARHGFKELEVHDPPYRKNQDFKAVNFGSFRGMPNFKHAEPYAVLKNLKDLPSEDAQHPIKWIKAALFGGLVGFVYGYAWFAFKPIQGFASKKLLASVGDRPYSGRTFR